MEKKFGHEDYEVLNELYRQYRQGHAEELKKWLEEDEGRKELFLDFLAMREVALSGRMQVPDVEEEWRHVSGRIGLSKRRRNTWWYAAAAVVLLCIGGWWGYTWFEHEAPAERSVVLMSALPQDGVTLTIGNEVLDLSGSRPDSLLGRHDYVDMGNGIAYAHKPVSESDDAVEEHVLSVPAGKQFRITLADGTLVCLNAETKLRYPSRFGDSREVYLEGEAYFEVAKDAGHPFVVHSGTDRVEVLGTKFGVSNYPETNPNATLLQGSVRVVSGEKFVVLSPNTQAVMMEGNIQVRKVRAEDRLAWTRGIYIFKDERFEDVMRQVGRMYGVHVEFQEQSLREKRVTGMIDRSDDLSFSLSLFDKVLGTEVEVTNGMILINRISSKNSNSYN